MGIRFACHHCGHPLNIKQELAGRVGRCPDCEQRFRIPLQDAPQSLPLSTAGEGTSQAPDQMAGREAAREPVARAAVAAATGAVSATQWYVRPPAGGQYGPANDELIQSWIAEFRITPSTLVWRDGWPQWKNASEVFPELADVAARNRPLTANPASDPATSAGLGVDPAAGGAGLIGDATLGQQRSARKRRRTRLVIGLAATVCCLLAALVLLWLMR